MTSREGQIKSLKGLHYSILSLFQRSMYFSSCVTCKYLCFGKRLIVYTLILIFQDTISQAPYWITKKYYIYKIQCGRDLIDFHFRCLKALHAIGTTISNDWLVMVINVLTCESTQKLDAQNLIITHMNSYLSKCSWLTIAPMSVNPRVRM